MQEESDDNSQTVSGPSASSASAGPEHEPDRSSDPVISSVLSYLIRRFVCVLEDIIDIFLVPMPMVVQLSLQSSRRVVSQ